MNKRTKLAIAASAAIWMVPMTRAVAGIDVVAGDWKIDFAGNVNAFYVGTSCATTASTTSTVAGGLACVGATTRLPSATDCCRRRWCSAPPRGNPISTST